MPERFVENHIRRMLLFEPLPPDQLTLVAEAFQVLRFEPGAVVFRQGQPAQGLFFFVSGRGVLTHADYGAEPQPAGQPESIIDDITANEFVGEKALFAETVEHASLRIVESSVVLFLSRQALARLLLDHPELRMNLSMVQKQQSIRPMFKGQQPDEVVLRVFKRHWWSYGRFIWIPLLIGTALIASAFLLAGNNVVALGLVGLALILPSAIMAYLFQEWQDDHIAVTDRRVVRVHNVWLGLQNSLSEIPLERVQEVSVVQPPADPFARIFNYGTVTVRTAGEVVPVSMAMIPRPDRLRTLIFAERDQMRRSEQERRRREIESEVERVLGLPTSDPVLPRAAESQALEAPEVRPGFTLNFLRMKFLNEAGDLVYRKHYTVWVRHVMFPALMCLFALFAIALAVLGVFPEYTTVMLVASLPVLLLGMVWFYLADWDWRNDHFILGDEMLTIVRKRPLWLQNVADQIRLDKVDSVASQVTGLTNNLLDRGTVRVSLLGDEEAKVIEGVFRPQEIQGEISSRLTRMRQQENLEDADRQREAIAQYLSAYHARVAGGEAQYVQASQDTMAREVSPTVRYEPEPPPAPPRDGVRPPRVPRTLPEDHNPDT